MDRKLWFSIWVFLFIVGRAQSQSFDKDSMQMVLKVNTDKSKLAKWQSQLSDKEEKKKSWAEKAQESADANIQAAQALSADPQNRRLARRANRHARIARRNARKARAALKRLDQLLKNIDNEQTRLSKDESKLNNYIDSHQTLVSPTPPPAMQDSVGN